MQKVTPCLWFDGQAEQAANFYVALLPGSRIERVVRSPVDTPGAAAGAALVVEFTLAGNRFTGLNGGPGSRSPRRCGCSNCSPTPTRAGPAGRWRR